MSTVYVQARHLAPGMVLASENDEPGTMITAVNRVLNGPVQIQTTRPSGTRRYFDEEFRLLVDSESADGIDNDGPGTVIPVESVALTVEVKVPYGSSLVVAEELSKGVESLVYDPDSVGMELAVVDKSTYSKEPYPEFYSDDGRCLVGAPVISYNC